MENSKKWGLITIFFSFFLSLASLVFSRNRCYSTSFSDSLADMLFTCLEVKIFQRTMYDIFGEVAYVYDEIFIPLKYLFLLSFLIFSIGILWYKSALPIPSLPKTNSKKPK